MYSYPYFSLMLFIIVHELRAIVIDHENPSMKNQIKQLVAVESEFLIHRLYFLFSIWFLWNSCCLNFLFPL